jgi:pyruvate dehydrogenase E2 component (dihydrolipoamide acetyltransferase)
MAEINAIAMPKWGLEMTEGTVLHWHVREGDAVTRGQVLMEIETEKVSNELEAEADGVLRRIVATEGDVRPIGELLAVIAGADVSDAEIDSFVGSYVSIAVGRVEATSAAAPAPPAPRATSEPPATAAAPTPAAQQRPSSANAVAPASNESVYSTPTARRLARVLGIDMGGITGSGRGGRVLAADVQAEYDDAGVPVAADVRATPTARRVARLLDVDLAAVRGTGRGGRISKDDVEAAARASGAGPVVASTAPAIRPAENGVTIEPLSAMRKTIARRLTESKQNVPHFYLTVDVELDRLIARREKLNAASETRVSLNDFVIRAAALALRQVPRANVQFHGDALHFFEQADISVAVAIAGGLVTPIVHGADTLSIHQIGAAAKDLASRARTGKLKMNEIEGGTLTISNLGMYGIRQFDAVINPPQAAVLAIGAGEQRIVVRNGAASVARMMTVTMSCDHRAIDGALGAEYLEALKSLLEEPMSLVV